MNVSANFTLLNKKWFFDPLTNNDFFNTMSFSILKIHCSVHEKSKLRKYINRLLRMFLIRVLNDLQWVLVLKHIQLVKTVRLLIFPKKKTIFLEGGQKSQFFSINNVKFAEKFIYGIKIDQKWCFDAFLTNFSIKVPFWGP